MCLLIARKVTKDTSTVLPLFQSLTLLSWSWD